MIQIPADAKVIDDPRLTPIRIIKSLGGKRLEEVILDVKADMIKADAKFARSDLALARLQDMSSGGYVPAEHLWELVKAKILPLEDFLKCVSVNSGPLAQFLSGQQIEKISTKGDPRGKALYVEFKPETPPLNFAAMEAAMIASAGAQPCAALPAKNYGAEKKGSLVPEPAAGKRQGPRLGKVGRPRKVVSSQ